MKRYSPALLPIVWGTLLTLVVPITALRAEDTSEDAADGGVVLVEAESFTSHGGWSLDTQFIREMGSPCLLAHGLGRPVADATTSVAFPATGQYRVFVRTKDWVARWKAPGAPGRFQLIINQQPLAVTFGTSGADWHWQDGGTIDIIENSAELALRDLTGFDGRCDAVCFCRVADDGTFATPPNEPKQLAGWRRKQLGLPDEPIRRDGYHLVVVGGGYAGMGAAISAARMGCKVALIQDRPVLGGNGSSEVRVWAMGNIRRGRFPRIGEIVEEFADRATKSPGTAEEFGDELKEQIVRAESNIDLFLNHHASTVTMENDRILSVTAFDTRSGEHSEFFGRFFSDCTGHATVGFLAGADWEIEDQGRMGMSNMWAWDELDEPTAFPETPWALDLMMDDFPYPRDHHGQWFWESGFDKDALGDAEGIRDWNLRAVYGAFNAMKNRDGADKHQTAVLTWVAYIGGPRESRRLLGDVVLTQDDIVSKREFPDGCVPSTWSIDLHYPKEQYAKKFPDNPFISIAVHDNRVDRSYGYPIPYRCLYSRNIANLFMAGRNISVTHEALGTTRVMKTCGMMGEVVGRAASLCILHHCDPRDVHDRYLSDLTSLLQLPGKARRRSVFDRIEIPADSMKLAGPLGPPTGIDPDSLGGILVDDRDAQKSGTWTEGQGLKGYVGYGYVYSGGEDSTIRFPFRVAESGRYDVRISWLPHENRAKNARVILRIDEKPYESSIDMTKPAPLENGFASLGVFEIPAGTKGSVELLAKGARGIVHADAVLLVPQPDVASGPEEIYSGPQIGEKLPPFSFLLTLGDDAGQEFDPVAAASGAPVILVFVHDVNRQSVGMTRILTEYTKSRSPDGLVTGVVFLDEDPTSAEATVRRIQHALTKDVATGVSPDGGEGPGSYGLNRNVTLTVLVAKNGTVTGNFALIQPSLQADLPKILRSVVDVVGGTVPRLEDLPGMTEMMPTRPAADAAPNLRPLLVPLIQQGASDEDVDKAAKAIDERAAMDAAVRKEVGRISGTIVDAGKLENYGTSRAQQHLQRWAREFRSDPGR